MSFDMSMSPTGMTPRADDAGGTGAAHGAQDGTRDSEGSIGAGGADAADGAHPPIPLDRSAVKRELEATLAARRELGPEFDAPLMDAFVERMFAQLTARLRQQPAPRQGPPHDQRLGLAITSMALLIPLVAIVLGMGMGLLGLTLVCLVIVAINLGFRFL
jgi:hypothetical protein